MPHSDFTIAPAWQAAHAARTANAEELATLLHDSRARTLALVDAYAAALGDSLVVPYSPQLNPPLWELGHIGWFQAYWIGRNPQRASGWDADPLCARSDSALRDEDGLYNSSLVPHTTRWGLKLPDLGATKHYLAKGLETSLGLLAQTGSSDRALYFYRLALFHEDMHSEAAIYMAQALGIALPHALTERRQSPSAPNPQPLILPDTAWEMGCPQVNHGAAVSPAESGFVFDNEVPAHRQQIASCEIDRDVVTWQQFLPFVEAGGYAQPQWWGEEAWQWLQRDVPHRAPRYLRRTKTPQGDSLWETCNFGVWQPLDLAAPACHLSYFEAQAWCQWAGRSLPTEAQWECAALTLGGFVWGQVWEWTASTFVPFPGFIAHPYRDYSSPWFGTRPVLRGASWATHGRMAHPRYRNFFTPERNDIAAGFRSCALVQP